MADAFFELNLRGDEFWDTAGKGPAGDMFARLGYSVDEVKGKLTDMPSFFDDVLTRISKLANESEKLRALDEIFGGSGEQMATFLRRGVDEIERGREEARKFGIVIDDDVIAKARELDAKFTQLSARLESSFKNSRCFDRWRL